MSVAQNDRDPAGDIAAMRALKFDEDPRTITQMIEADAFEDVTIDKVERGDGGWLYLQWDGGTGSGFRPPGGVEPKVGDVLRIYGGAGLGDVRHGWALNGVLVEWRTPWERFAERVRWLAQNDRDKRERFEREESGLDDRVAALPTPLKARIERFRREDPKFRVDSEAYEMATVGDAPKIARALAAENGWTLDERTLRAVGVSEEAVREAVEAFRDADWDEQVARVPSLDKGHSGNTFGGAVALSYHVLAGHDV